MVPGRSKLGSNPSVMRRGSVRGSRRVLAFVLIACALVMAACAPAARRTTDGPSSRSVREHDARRPQYRSPGGAASPRLVGEPKTERELEREKARSLAEEQAKQERQAEERRREAEVNAEREFERCTAYFDRDRAYAAEKPADIAFAVRVNGWDCLGAKEGRWECLRRGSEKFCGTWIQYASHISPEKAASELRKTVAKEFKPRVTSRKGRKRSVRAGRRAIRKLMEVKDITSERVALRCPDRADITVHSLKIQNAMGAWRRAKICAFVINDDAWPIDCPLSLPFAVESLAKGESKWIEDVYGTCSSAAHEVTVRIGRGHYE